MVARWACVVAGGVCVVARGCVVADGVFLLVGMCSCQGV